MTNKTNSVSQFSQKLGLAGIGSDASQLNWSRLPLLANLFIVLGRKKTAFAFLFIFAHSFCYYRLVFLLNSFHLFIFNTQHYAHFLFCSCLRNAKEMFWAPKPRFKQTSWAKKDGKKSSRQVQNKQHLFRVNNKKKKKTVPRHVQIRCVSA